MLLSRIQGHIPLCRKPFLKLATELGVSEEEVINTIRELKEERLIRQISPIYDTRAVGYDSSLVAFKVNPKRVEEVAEFVSSHPGVSHNYQREHEFNLWFTIAVPPDSILGLDETVSLMAQLTSVEEFLILRTVKTYKIGVKLSYKELCEKEEVNIATPREVTLSSLDRRVIAHTQLDIPLISNPFDLIASAMDIETEALLGRLSYLKETGVMRRFSAILFHRRAGFKANGMVVWKIPADRVDEVGNLLASFKSVSHCYQRTTSERWHFNLFSMVHGRSREEVLDFVYEVAGKVKPEEFKVLFSTREFKKKRIKLFSEEFYEWERKHVGAYSH